MVGKVLGHRYQLDERIGGGGMAVVFKGQDTLLNRTVTVKILREQYAQDQDFIRRFRREAQAVASLSHPNIVSIYDVGQEEGLHYLVMEYIEGRTLKSIIEENGLLEQALALKLCQQVCDALQHAHDHGVIHRDIKPHNILITTHGRVKVTDFGIALAASHNTMTYDGSMVGSVHYISPEQARGQVTSFASDVYSTGMMLYEMLTGQVPFTGEDPISIAIKQVQESPPSPRSLNMAITPSLERVVLKAIAKEPERRYLSARDMWMDLERVRLSAGRENDMATQILPTISGKPLAKSVSRSRRPRRRLRPIGTVFLSLLVLALLYGAYTGFQGWLLVPETRVPDVVNLPLYQAQQQLADAGLRLEEGERINHPLIQSGNVAAQSIPPNTVIRRGRVVTVDISTGPQLVEVPDVTGQPIRLARSTLLDEEFAVDQEHSEVSSPDIQAGRVVATVPAPRTRQPKGTTIRLIVSSGPPSQLVTMPNLIGKTIEAARQEMDSAQLVVGTLEYEDSTQFLPNQVTKQEPSPGGSVPQGTTVNLVLSKGPGPAMDIARVSIPVPKDGKVHDYRIEVTDIKGTRVEFAQKRTGGETISVSIPFYGKGKIRVYQDNVLLYEQNVP